MAIVQSILVNGQNRAWVNLNMLVMGVRVVSMTEINYDKDTDIKYNYGIGADPISYAQGNNTYSASITLMDDEVRQIIAAAPNGELAAIPPFTISLIFDGVGVAYAEDTLNNCKFTKDSFKASQGSTGFYRTIPIKFAGLIHK